MLGATTLHNPRRAARYQDVRILQVNVTSHSSLPPPPPRAGLLDVFGARCEANRGRPAVALVALAVWMTVCPKRTNPVCRCRNARPPMRETGSRGVGMQGEARQCENSSVTMLFCENQKNSRFRLTRLH